MKFNFRNLTGDDFRLLAAALYAVTPTGGGSPQHTLLMKICPAKDDQDFLTLVGQLAKIAHDEYEEFLDNIAEQEQEKEKEEEEEDENSFVTHPLRVEFEQTLLLPTETEAWKEYCDEAWNQEGDDYWNGFKFDSAQAIREDFDLYLQERD